MRIDKKGFNKNYEVGCSDQSNRNAMQSDCPSGRTGSDRTLLPNPSFTQCSKWCCKGLYREYFGVTLLRSVSSEFITER
jgi:hypothetical protein